MGTENTKPGWAKCQLNEGLEQISGNSSLIKGRLTPEPKPGLYPAFSASGQDVWHHEAEYQGNAIIVSAVGARCGKAFLAKGAWSAIANTHVLFPNEKALDTVFAWYLLNNEHFWVKGGSAQPFVKIKASLEKTIGLPPLNEQRRIVAKIEELFSELDKGVESLKTARAQLKTYRQSLLKAAFEGRLTEQWRRDNADKLETADQLLERIREEREARYHQQLEEWKAAVAEWEEDNRQGKKPRKPRANKTVAINFDDSLENVDGWLWQPLAEISGPIVDGTHKTPRYVDTGVPFISAKDITDFSVNFSETRFISQGEHEALIRRCCPTKSDVLVTKSGTIGRVAVVGTDEPFSLFESVALVPVPKCMDARFVAYACYFFINSGYAEKTQKGVAVRHLHLEDLRRLPIPVAPIQEQERVVQIIEDNIASTREVENDIERELARAEHLRQAILKRAFEGKLVPQDPDDEPASRLLERIRQEQVDAPKAKRRKRQTESPA